MQICPFCHTGRVELRKIVYVQYHSPNAIIVDRIPALVCDTCGEKSYDPDAMENLQRLLWSTGADEPLSYLIKNK